MNKNIRDYINLIETAQQGVAEGSENNNTMAQKIFFARSNKAPKGWSYDHVGFITQDGKQIQMSGHKGNDVYVTNDVTDDPEFPKQNIKIVSLSKPVSVPTTNSVGAENCGTFVANVLQANGIKGINTQKIYSVFKKPHEQGVAEGSLNEFAPDGFNGGDDDEGFSPEIAKMAQEDGFTKGASLADGATLERAMSINHWHNQHGGMYKQYFAKGFKQGRMNKIRHDNKQYNLNLKLMKDGSIRRGEQK